MAVSINTTIDVRIETPAGMAVTGGAGALIIRATSIAAVRDFLAGALASLDDTAAGDAIAERANAFLGGSAALGRVIA